MRDLLPVVLLIVVAGCASLPGGGVQAPTGPCEEVAVPGPPMTTSENVSAKSYPEPPVNLTEQTARSYVTSYEEALRHNRDLADRPTTVELNIGIADVSVEQHGGVFVVQLESITRGTFAEGTEYGSPSYTLWDGAPVEVGYMLTADRLVRAEAGGEGDVRPGTIREGTTLECF
jgi:hypothetical protein